MATAKVKNGSVANEMLADATKVAEEAKEIVNSWVEVSNKAVADTKPMFDANQKMLESGYAIWYEASKTYLDFVTKATEQTLAQSMAFQNDMAKIFQVNAKEIQEMAAAQQAFAFASLESTQGQIKEASEALGKMVTPIN
jgi:hypothetical protein